jgi:hypothetical protein
VHGRWNNEHHLDNAGFIGRVGVYEMTTAQKETIVQSWPYPFPEYLALLRWTRDEKLKSAGRDEDDKRKIETDYEEKLNRMFVRPPK